MIKEGIIFQSHDLKYHIIWLQHFSKQLAEGIWYPRWLAGDNYGYGSPVFIFYPPLVYYIGSILKFSGLTIEQTITSLFFLAVFLAGLAFYFCTYKNFGIIASLIGALLYISNPYISLNLYTRGALAETWSLIWIPIGWWIIPKAITHKNSRIFVAILATLIALTHVPNLLIFTICGFVYTIFMLLRHHYQKVLTTIFYYCTGLGLASFFLIPAILEKSLINIDHMRFNDGYKRHLISFGLVKETVKFSKNMDSLFTWQLSCVAALIIILFLLRKKQIIIHTKYWIIFIIITGFLMTYPSIFIWDSSTTLQMVQFPWRLFGIFSFGIYGLLTAILHYINEDTIKKRAKLLIFFLVFTIFIGNLFYSYKISLIFPGLNNPGNISSGSWKTSRYNQITVSINDPYTDKTRGPKEYRPLLEGTEEASPSPIIQQPKISLIKGKADIDIEQWQSYQRNFKITTFQDSIIRIRTYYYPAWHIYINNQLSKLRQYNDGTIVVYLPPGEYDIKLIYQKTKAFILGIILSIISFILLTAYNIIHTKNTDKIAKIT